MQEFTADMTQYLDSEHAAALPHRGVPETISGARRLIKGAGVQAAWCVCVCCVCVCVCACVCVCVVCVCGVCV
jgi:hypothetical protein